MKKTPGEKVQQSSNLNKYLQEDAYNEQVQAIERMAETADREGRYDDVILPEPQAVPEDLRETYARAKDTKSFRTVNSSSLTCSLIERLGAAEQRWKDEQQGNIVLTNKLEAAYAERDRLKDAQEDYQARLWCALGQPENIEFIDAVKQLQAERDRLRGLSAAVYQFVGAHALEDDGLEKWLDLLSKAARGDAFTEEAVLELFPYTLPQDRSRTNHDTGNCRCYGCVLDRETSLRAKVAELEGKLQGVTTEKDKWMQRMGERDSDLLDGRGDSLAAHDAQVRREALEEARQLIAYKSDINSFHLVESISALINMKGESIGK